MKENGKQEKKIRRKKKRERKEHVAGKKKDPINCFDNNH